MGGFIVAGAGRRFYYAGDTGYSPDFKDIAQRFAPIDLAAIPIGAYAPRWFMRSQHVNPEEAAQIFLDLKARAAVGVHWGTFPLTDEPMDEPPKRLADARRKLGIPDQAFFTMAIGETRRFDQLP